ncbi:MAG TPA: sulfite exporter TauE/SafE family protein [Acetobacteraceae bacterium]|jgi:hypothetical protein
MTPLLAAGIAAIVLGMAIGATGIGGVLLVPILTLALGIDVKRAIAAALLSYLPGCMVAVVMYARRGSIVWRDAWPLCLAALPAAWLGARAARGAPAGLLEAAIGGLLLAGGLYALRTPRDVTVDGRRLGSGVLIGLGGGTGFVSALTGAGGAFVLLPVLLLLDVPVLPAIGLGQSIALPIAGLASVANIQAGLVDVPLAALLAAGLSVGIAVGTPIAHALPQPVLRRLLGGFVVVAGAGMLLRIAMQLLGA